MTRQDFAGNLAKTRLLLWEVHGAPMVPTLSGCGGSKLHLWIASSNMLFKLYMFCFANRIVNEWFTNLSMNVIFCISTSLKVFQVMSLWNTAESRHLPFLVDLCFLLWHLKVLTNCSSSGDQTLPFGQFSNISNTFSIKHVSGQCSARTARHARVFSTFGMAVWVTPHCRFTQSGCLCADGVPSSNAARPNPMRSDMPLHASRSAALLPDIRFHWKGYALSSAPCLPAEFQHHNELLLSTQQYTLVDRQLWKLFWCKFLSCFRTSCSPHKAHALSSRICAHRCTSTRELGTGYGGLRWTCLYCVLYWLWWWTCL